MVTEIIALVANITLALSFVVGLVFGIAQVRSAARDRRERLTLEALRNFQTREFAELMYYIISRNIPENREALDTLPQHDRILFIQFGQQMESLGILVAEKFIDLDLVDKTLGSLVTTAWDKYKTMVFSLRKRDPYLNEYFQWLAERIDERLKKPREPFYKRNF